MIAKTQEARLVGNYKKTSLDTIKSKADFLLTGIDGHWYSVVFKNGRQERIFGKRAFKKLCKSFPNFTTDF